MKRFFKKIAVFMSFVTVAVSVSFKTAEASTIPVVVGLTKYTKVSTVPVNNIKINIYSEWASDVSETLVSEKGFQIVAGSGSFSIKSDGTTVKTYQYANAPYIQADGGLTKLGEVWYRGYIRPVAASSGFTITNTLSESEYLYSVVPCEMLTKSHPEALKAQAVAARTFMEYSRNRHSQEGYEVCDSTHCQVYNGTTKEHENTTAAVDATAEQKIYYNGEIINSVFFSSSGGYTEDSENVWGSVIPYLRSVKEVNEVVFKQYSETFTLQELTNALGIGQVKSITAEFVPTGRLISLTVNGSSGKKTYERDNIRSFGRLFSDTSLPSTMFTINGYGYQGAPPAAKQVQSSASLPSVYLIGASGKQAAGGETYGVGSNESIGKVDINNSYVIGQDGKKQKVNIPQTAVQQPSAEVTQSGTTHSVTINSSTITIEGRGYGHGCGMSQDGADGMAQLGYDYKQILTHYYTGVEVK